MKKLILILLAIVGVLAPCVVTVNICRACNTEQTMYVEYIDKDERAIAEQSEQCGARLRMLINAEKIKRCFKELVVTAVSCGYRDRNKEKPTEKRTTYLFYSRQAGGLPSDTLSPI